MDYAFTEEKEKIGVKNNTNRRRDKIDVIISGILDLPIQKIFRCNIKTTTSTLLIVLDFYHFMYQ